MPALPKTNRRKAWERTLDVLTKDGTDLKAFVRTWQLCRNDDNPYQEWTVDMLPAVRVMVVGGASKPSAESLLKGTLLLNFQLGLKGTNAGDMIDFWGAIEAVLFPGGPYLLNLLNPFGVFATSVSQPAISSKLYDGKVRGQYAEGQLILGIQTTT
jgi:hypothetical protein